MLFKLDGVNVPEIATQHPLDPIERGPVYRIVTPRISDPNPIGEYCCGLFMYPKPKKGYSQII